MLALIFLLSAGEMRDALEFRASGKGGFAFNKDFKIPIGTECVLRRDPTNKHGKFDIKQTHYYMRAVLTFFFSSVRSKLHRIASAYGCSS